MARKLILHVVESYAGGVQVAIDDYVRNTPDVDHALLYSPRRDAPLLMEDFPQFVTAHQLPGGHLARISAVRAHVSRLRPAIIHSHSSFGGLYARLAVSARRHRVIYTPHCYAFERRDIGTPVRSAYWLAERLLRLNTSAIGACSPREAALSRGSLGPAVVYLPNVMPPDLVHQRHIPERAVIVGAGRASAQKDPQFFARTVDAIRRLRGPVDALWIGGDEALRREFAANDIGVTGWVPRSEASRLVAGASVYVHSAKWEGFPLAILEAVAFGTPVIARDISALDGYELPGKVPRPEDAVAIWDRAVTKEGRQELALAAARAFAYNTDEHQQAALGQLYELE